MKFVGQFSVRRFLSHDCTPLEQFVKYGAIGVMATLVQLGGFYLLAATCCKCLGAGDWMVLHLGLPSTDLPDGVRSARFAIDTASGFVFANVFCWLMNRAFVFRPGKFAWYVEFAMFFGAAATATLVATALCSLLIRSFGMMSTLAALIEVVVSFAINFFVRKFLIFRG